VSLSDLEIKTTSLHKLTIHFIDSTPPVTWLDISISTLNSLSKLGMANIGFVVKILFILSNASCWSVLYCYFMSFLVNIFSGLAILVKSLTNLL